MDMGVLWEMFLTHWGSICRFQFTVGNPVFWVGLCVLILLLSRFWDIKKSFSFGVVVGVVLLAATRIEFSLAATMEKAGEPFDPIVVRLLSVVVICLVVLYYVFIKSDSNF